MNSEAQVRPTNRAGSDTDAARPALAGLADAVPPHVWFCVSAIFHYLGPAFAVLLFAQVGVLGMAWLRIATAALVFAPLTRPWAVFTRADRSARLLLLAFGACLAVMNCAFYLALDRLPISLVAAIEFVGTIGVAMVGLRTPRNFAALAIAVAGTLLLIDVKWSSDPVGLFWAFLNGALFIGYIVLGHRIARTGLGIAGLGTAMAIALLVVLPVGFSEALPAFSAPQLLIAGIGVGLCSSVIPYICDQLAMARLARASFALMLSLLPLTATLIGVVVLRQVPSLTDCLGIALVVAGVAMHKPAPE
ncbi:DMT family transporter [Mesorhizobium sp. M1A.F.Ca.IN.020.06.1.1]|uniref:EamA family transporter n=2 Tax=Mesorhizobium TaxID=68287 RepID=UPI000BAF1844|nr:MULTISPECIES: DMT family transporter [unclassified Mesorhizobium]WIE94226.1 DMT family transporter [Mesorhizobium sp. WSM4875]PBB31731.1 EamA family transporter [Mesorhizobium sp. WSM3882]RUU96203.1 DMT family transporter [Mesorhizobium sp. M1A.F.Ca.IN.020.03.2.1]RUV85280.1 DMT family transporter [Mesorhizobium sp. M1A.F.Ca.IN.020.32.1.1]RUW11136.1 DMT family transporter [Mesorhizobium sp. M1A.F.Ca.IN.022.05.2.1]